MSCILAVASNIDPRLFADKTSLILFPNPLNKKHYWAKTSFFEKIDLRP
jgi:hypothetical protein